MDQVMLRSGDDQWLARDEVDLDAQAVGDPYDKVERWIRAASLDRRDMVPRDADCVGERLLTDVEHRPSVEAKARKRHSEVGRHGWSEPDEPYLALIRARPAIVWSVSGTGWRQVRVIAHFVRPWMQS